MKRGEHTATPLCYAALCWQGAALPAEQGGKGGLGEPQEAWGLDPVAAESLSFLHVGQASPRALALAVVVRGPSAWLSHCLFLKVCAGLVVTGVGFQYF